MLSHSLSCRYIPISPIWRKPFFFFAVWRTILLCGRSPGVEKLEPTCSVRTSHPIRPTAWLSNTCSKQRSIERHTVRLGCCWRESPNSDIWTKGKRSCETSMHDTRWLSCCLGYSSAAVHRLPRLLHWGQLGRHFSQLVRQIPAQHLCFCAVSLLVSLLGSLCVCALTMA